MNNLKRNIDVENKDESTTIINEDNFEIINNSKFEDEINENNKEKSRTKTSSSLEKSNKIFIKDAKGEEQLRFEFMKEYTKKGTNNDNNFLRRMHNDIDKRKNMEKIMDKFIEQTKFKSVLIQDKKTAHPTNNISTIIQGIMHNIKNTEKIKAST